MLTRPALTLLLSGLAGLSHASSPQDPGPEARAAFVWDQAHAFQQARAAVRNSKGLWGYIDTRGQAITGFEYERAGDFNEGLAQVTRDGLTGYIDLSGQIVIALQYNRGGSDFQAGLAKVRHYDEASNTWTHACIDSKGQTVASAKFEGQVICHYHEGWAVTGKGGLQGFTDRDGHMLRIELPKPLLSARPDSDDTTGKPMQTLSAEEAAHFFVFDEARPFREGLAAVARGGRWAYLDPQGRIAFTLEASTVHDFHEGLAAIQRSDGRFAFVDRQGQAQTGFDFLAVLDFSEGLAAVRTDAGWGYIDSRGQWLIEPRYAAASSFKNDRARVCSEQPNSPYIICNYIDRNGQTAIPIQGYSAARDFSHGLAAVLHHRLGLWGHIDTQGRPLKIKP